MKFSLIILFFLSVGASASKEALFPSATLGSCTFTLNSPQGIKQAIEEQEHLLASTSLSSEQYLTAINLISSFHRFFRATAPTVGFDFIHHYFPLLADRLPTMSLFLNSRGAFVTELRAQGITFHPLSDYQRYPPWGAASSRLGELYSSQTAMHFKKDRHGTSLKIENGPFLSIQDPVIAQAFFSHLLRNPFIIEEWGLGGVDLLLSPKNGQSLVIVSIQRNEHTHLSLRPQEQDTLYIISFNRNGSAQEPTLREQSLLKNPEILSGWLSTFNSTERAHSYFLPIGIHL